MELCGGTGIWGQITRIGNMFEYEIAMELEEGTEKQMVKNLRDVDNSHEDSNGLCFFNCGHGRYPVIYNCNVYRKKVEQR